jgi:hypothetical protein
VLPLASLGVGLGGGPLQLGLVDNPSKSPKPRTAAAVCRFCILTPFALRGFYLGSYNFANPFYFVNPWRKRLTFAPLTNSFLKKAQNAQRPAAIAAPADQSAGLWNVKKRSYLAGAAPIIR